MRVRLCVSLTDPWHSKEDCNVKQKLIPMSFVIGALLSLSVFLGWGNLNGLSHANAATWTQVWSDEFNGSANTGVSTSNWLYDTGTGYGCSGCPANWGTGEIETMTNSTANVYQDGSGHLAIKPIRSASGSWTSGRIETQRTDFAAPSNGILAIEASLQMPNVTGAAAQGYWPAFWTLGTPFRGNYLNWPSIGEIDIMENVNGVNTEYGTFHCGTSSGGPCNETSGIGGNSACSPTTCQAAYHTYRMELDKSVSPNQIRWYLDGVNFFTVNSSQFDATTWSNATNHGFFVILNVAMGGGWPGSPTASTTSGAPMLVDYVRVYTSAGSTGTTPTPTPTSGTCTSGSFTQGVVNSSTTAALPWFTPCDWTAGYVILHYIRPGLDQQNVYMTYNSSTARWEYSVSGISASQVLQYSFTYQKSGLQYDTAWYSWTHP
jgi:beta-glucanase (GH16 family)